MLGNLSTRLVSKGGNPLPPEGFEGADEDLSPPTSAFPIVLDPATPLIAPNYG